MDTMRKKTLVSDGWLDDYHARNGDDKVVHDNPLDESADADDSIDPDIWRTVLYSGEGVYQPGYQDPCRGESLITLTGSGMGRSAGGYDLPIPWNREEPNRE